MAWRCCATGIISGAARRFVKSMKPGPSRESHPDTGKSESREGKKSPVQRQCDSEEWYASKALTNDLNNSAESGERKQIDTPAVHVKRCRLGGGALEAARAMLSLTRPGEHGVACVETQMN